MDELSTMRAVRVDTLAWTYVWEAQREMFKGDQVSFSFVRRCVLEFDVLFPRIEDGGLADLLNRCMGELEVQSRWLERRQLRGGVCDVDEEGGYLNETDCEWFERFRDDTRRDIGGNRLSVIEEVSGDVCCRVLADRVRRVRERVGYGGKEW